MNPNQCLHQTHFLTVFLGESRVGKLKIIGQYRIFVPSPFNKICGNSFLLHIAVPEDFLLKRCVDTFPSFWRPRPLFFNKFSSPRSAHCSWKKPQEVVSTSLCTTCAEFRISESLRWGLFDIPGGILPLEK